MNNIKALIIGVTLSAPFTTQAAIVSGWGAYADVSTASNCPSYCTSANGGVFAYANDGLGTGGSTVASTALSNASGNAQAYTELTGTGYTPILRAATSTPTGITGATATAFGIQGFTYTGTGSTTLSLNIDLHGINSADNPDAQIRTDIGILRGSSIDFYPDFATQVYEASWPSTLETTRSIFLTTAGESTVSDLIEITLNPGDDFFLVASLEARSYRGASADAWNTLTMQFDDSSNLQAASVSAVPLPAAVWLFGSGLIAMIGMAKRRS